jgi:hypothetical protein
MARFTLQRISNDCHSIRTGAKQVGFVRQQDDKTWNGTMGDLHTTGHNERAAAFYAVVRMKNDAFAQAHGYSDAAAMVAAENVVTKRIADDINQMAAGLGMGPVVTVRRRRIRR